MHNFNSAPVPYAYLRSTLDSHRSVHTHPYTLPVSYQNTITMCALSLHVSECTWHSPVSMCPRCDSGLLVAPDTCVATCR